MHITRHDMGPRFSEMTVVHLAEARLIYLAGQVAENTALDVTGQTRDVLAHIDRLLEGVGADKTHVLSATIYLRSVGDYAAMNAAWDDWVPAGHAPARATVAAKLVDSAYSVEIQVTAAVAGAGAG